jgi:hypothetical protein
MPSTAGAASRDNAVESTGLHLLTSEHCTVQCEPLPVSFLGESSILMKYWLVEVLKANGRNPTAVELWVRLKWHKVSQAHLLY